MIELKDTTLIAADDFHGQPTVEAMKRFLQVFKFSSVKFITNKFDSPWSVPSRHPILGMPNYNRFNWNYFAEYFDTPKVLYMQSDCWIINPESWEDIFMSYDYNGAPWWFDERNVGSGGMLIASRKLYELIQGKDFNPENIPGDEYVGRHVRADLEAKGIKFAPEDVARRFCWEQNNKYPQPFGNPFGLHGTHTAKAYGLI